MPIPTAVSPSQLTPGLYLSVDLLAGAASPGTGTLRVALIATKGSAGDLTDDTEVRAGGGVDTAATAFGTGTPGHLAAKQVYRKFPAAQVDFISPVAGSGTATLNITFAGAPSSNNSVLFDVVGREFEVSWLVGESADDMRDKAIAAINQRTNDLPVTASSGGAGICQIDFKVAGNIGNDALVKAVLSLAQTGTETVTGAATHTNLAGGTTDPDLTNALSALEGREYHLILPCLSNADAVNVASASNPSRIVTHISGLNTGLNAKLQSFVYGSTTTIAAATAATVHANNAGNVEYGQLVTCVNGRSLPCEFAAREVGGRLAVESVDPSGNRIGELYDGVFGSNDVIADTPSLAQSETALGAGVSLISYTAQGLLQLVRPITTHSQDDAGGPDRRLLDVQNVSATYIVARDLRTALPQEFSGAKVTEDVEAGDDPPPPGVVEERDIRGFIISRMRFWEREGVVTRASIDTAIADGTLIVQVNATDPTQVDIVLPFSIVQPLAKIGLTVQRVPS